MLEFGRCGAPCFLCPFFVKTKFLAKSVEKLLPEASDEIKRTLEKLLRLQCKGCGESIFACEVKECCEERKLEHCYECEEFICEKLKHLWKNYPDYLDKFKKFLAGEIEAEELALIQPKEGKEYVREVIQNTHMMYWCERFGISKKELELLLRWLSQKF